MKPYYQDSAVTILLTIKRLQDTFMVCTLQKNIKSALRKLLEKRGKLNERRPSLASVKPLTELKWSESSLTPDGYIGSAFRNPPSLLTCLHSQKRNGHGYGKGELTSLSRNLAFRWGTSGLCQREPSKALVRENIFSMFFQSHANRRKEYGKALYIAHGASLFFCATNTLAKSVARVTAMGKLSFLRRTTLSLTQSIRHYASILQTGGLYASSAI